MIRKKCPLPLLPKKRDCSVSPERLQLQRRLLLLVRNTGGNGLGPSQRQESIPPITGRKGQTEIGQVGGGDLLRTSMLSVVVEVDLGQMGLAIVPNKFFDFFSAEPSVHEGELLGVNR